MQSDHPMVTSLCNVHCAYFTLCSPVIAITAFDFIASSIVWWNERDTKEPHNIMSKVYQTLHLIRGDDKIDVLTLNRADNLNAMSPLMMDELLNYFQELENGIFQRVSFAHASCFLKH